MRARNPIAAAVLAALAVASGACGGGIDPGEYVVYRVAFTGGEKSEGCYADEEVPIDVKSDSSDLRDASTFILWAPSDEAVMLDAGDLALEGAEDGEGYVFNGKVTDVAYPAGAEGPKLTVTTTYTVEVTVDGEAISGVSKAKTTAKCSGSNACPDAQSCTVTSDFVGSLVEEAGLEYGVPSKGGVPTGS